MFGVRANTVLRRQGGGDGTGPWLLLAGLSTALTGCLTLEPRFQWGAEVAGMVFLGALWGAALLLERWKGYDKWLLPIAGTANVCGLLLSFRLEPGTFYRQTVYSVLGLALLVALVSIARRYPAWPEGYRWMSCLAMGVLLLTGLFGRQVNGARSWLILGGLGFEPSQPALAIFALAIGMVFRRETREIWWLAAAAILLMMTHNLGAILVLVLLLGGGAYLQGWSWRRLGLLAAGFLALGVSFYFIFPVVHERLALWFKQGAGVPEVSWQMVMAFQAFAKGRLWGVGFRTAVPGNIPAAGNDFVFAAWAEIAGVWVTWLILGLYLAYLYRGLKGTARVFPGAALSVRTLALSIACQALLLAGGNIGVLPLTGVPMPFVSTGGSTIVGSYLTTGMILSLGPPGELGVRERKLFGTAFLVTAALGLAVLGRSFG